MQFEILLLLLLLLAAHLEFIFLSRKNKFPLTAGLEIAGKEAMPMEINPMH